MEASAVKEQDGNSGALAENEQLSPGGLPEELQQINREIEQSLSDLLQSDMITVRGNEQWLEVELKSSLLFDSGDSTLSVPALELLSSLASILKVQTNPVRVEGFTDNQPINSVRYPSNWELSAGRAAAVVKFFIEEGVAANRLAAIGYGEHQPVNSNDTESGRAENRRVVLMISKTGELRPALREIASPEEIGAGSDEPPEAIVDPEPEPFKEQGNTGIEIIIPGVAVREDEQLPAVGEAPAEPGPEQTRNGVRVIELEGGGLLFTNDTPREDEE